MPLSLEMKEKKHHREYYFNDLEWSISHIIVNESIICIIIYTSFNQRPFSCRERRDDDGDGRRQVHRFSIIAARQKQTNETAATDGSEAEGRRDRNKI